MPASAARRAAKEGRAGAPPEVEHAQPCPSGMKFCPRLRAGPAYRPVRAQQIDQERHWLATAAPVRTPRQPRASQRLHGSTRHYHLKQRYGIGAAEVEQMLDAQRWACLLCDTQLTLKRPTSITITSPARSAASSASTATAGSASSGTTRRSCAGRRCYVERSSRAADEDTRRRHSRRSSSAASAHRGSSSPGRESSPRPTSAPRHDGAAAAVGSACSCGHAREGTVGKRPCRLGATSGRLPHPRQLVVRRVPRRALARAAPRPPHAAGHRVDHRGAARHHDRRADLPRRRRDGRRPARDDGQLHRPARHREGLPRRRLLLRRHRRRSRHRHRDGPAVPGRARALREDRGRHAVPRGQGEPAGADDPRQPGDGDAGPRRRPAVRRLRPGRRRRRPRPAGSSPTTSPAAATRSTSSTRSAPARCSPAAP